MMFHQGKKALSLVPPRFSSQACWRLEEEGGRSGDSRNPSHGPGVTQPLGRNTENTMSHGKGLLSTGLVNTNPPPPARKLLSAQFYRRGN